MDTVGFMEVIDLGLGPGGFLLLGLGLRLGNRTYLSSESLLDMGIWNRLVPMDWDTWALGCPSGHTRLELGLVQEDMGLGIP